MLKTPTGVLGLIALWTTCQKLRSDAITSIALISPIVGIVGTASAFTPYNDLRYVLPSVPFLFITISDVAATRPNGSKWRLYVTAVLTGFAIAESLSVYPHSLSFFNVVAGGPKSGDRYLIESNFDWGQDLHRVERWLSESPDVRLDGLAYFGVVDPSAVGIVCGLPPSEPRPGCFAVSASALRGIHWPLSDGRWGVAPRQTWDFSYFLSFQPKLRVGYSILVYEVTVDQANRVRREMGLPLLSP